MSLLTNPNCIYFYDELKWHNGFTIPCSLYPEDCQPTGAANFSRIERIELGFDYCIKPSEICKMDLKFYNKGSNIIGIKCLNHNIINIISKKIQKLYLEDLQMELIYRSLIIKYKEIKL